MSLAGISYAEFEFLFFNCAILAGWPLLALVALWSLRGRGPGDLGVDHRRGAVPGRAGVFDRAAK